jgi:NADH:ubiquinone oxidoreductase subunit 2 (subunit N)
MLSFANSTLMLSQYTSILLLISNYIFITTVSFLIFNGLQLVNLNNSTTNSNISLIIIIFNILFFLNLAGVPPLPGFFIKLTFLINLIKYINIYLIIILIIINFTIFYFYIQFYKTIQNYSKIRKINLNSKLIKTCLVAVFILINFYPLYNLVLLFF